MPKAKKLNPYFLLAGLVFILILVVGYFYLYKPQIKNSEMLEGEGIYTVSTQTVNYFENSQGFLAKPEQEGNYPGIIMIHEWWGLNDNIKDMAKQLAGEGYVVLAVDLYEGKIATTSDEARQYVSSLDQEKALENMKAATSYVKSQGSTKVASLGWCFGGGQSLQLALNEPLDATVIYYGNLVTNETRLDVVEWPVLGIFGDQDTSIPVETVNEFDVALEDLNIENEIYIYPGVGHAFANPSGMNYAPQQTQDAWKKTVNFLDKHLKEG